MDPRFVTRNIHAWLDYPVAMALVTLPFMLQLGSSHPLALWLSVFTGVAAFFLTVFTDHQFGVFRVLPYSLHLAVDFIVGASFVLTPFMLGFSGIDAWFYWANGVAVLTVILLSRPETDAKRVVHA